MGKNFKFFENNMNDWAKKYEEWIKAHLPEEYANDPVRDFNGHYLDGLTVMQEGERGGPDVEVFRAENEEDLRWWLLMEVCKFLDEKTPRKEKVWRYYRDHAEDGGWFYVEHRHYDYNAIDDPRLYGFECYLRALKYGFPPGRWEKEVQRHVWLMNRWFRVPHWDYDREKCCFIEISDSKEYDRDIDPVEEPRPGSIVKIVD